MIEPSVLKLEKVSEDNNISVFKIGPLTKSYGHTIGNIYRRVLLSSILGAAPKRVTIDGANHTFMTIEGVKEDVYKIVLNIKDLVFKVDSEGFEEHTITIEANGVTTITAGDLKLPSGVEVINPKQPICTLTAENSKFKAEIVISNGYGFELAEERDVKVVDAGVIQIDSLYSPIKLVDYKVNKTRLGKDSDLDEVVLTITTDGSVDVEESIKYAAAQVRDYFSVISEGVSVVRPEMPEDQIAVVSEEVSEKKSIFIDELNLPTRTVNALKKQNINSLQDLADLDEDQLLSIRNLGEKSIREIKKLLKSENLRD